MNTDATSAPASREERRDALVLAAYNQIAERGFEGLRTREVAAEAGVNIATLHYYFPTKEALIRGVVEHAMRRFRSTLAPHGTPEGQLRNHLRAVRRLLQDEPQLGAVMGELSLRSARDPAIARIMPPRWDCPVAAGGRSMPTARPAPAMRNCGRSRSIRSPSASGSASRWRCANR